MPPINISRPRIKNVTLMADAAEMPNAPSAKTWLASSAPSPPGKGTRNASKPAVHAAMVCENDKLTCKKDVMKKYSLTMPIAASNETPIAANNAERCLRQNVPAMRSDAATKRTNLLLDIFRKTADIG